MQSVKLPRMGYGEAVSACAARSVLTVLRRML
jgi:hypothetical protein